MPSPFGPPLALARFELPGNPIAEQAEAPHTAPHLEPLLTIPQFAARLGMSVSTLQRRIADKTVAEEYFNVTEKVEALYGQPRQLPRDDEGAEMRKLRGEMHRRMLGNGHCARPVETDCHFESICESCTFFVTTIEFRPTLQAQRDDAQNKGQVARQKIFDGLLKRLDHEAS